MSPSKRGRALAAVLSAALVCGPGAGVGAQPDTANDEMPPIDEDALATHLPEDRLTPGIERMELDGPAYHAARAELWEAIVDRDRASATAALSAEAESRLRVAIDDETRARTEAHTRRLVVVAELAEVADARAEIAVAEFMGIGSEDDLGLQALDLSLAADSAAIPLHGDMARAVFDERQAVLDADRAAIDGEIATRTSELKRLQAELADTRAVLTRSRLTSFVRSGQIPQLADVVVETRWATRVVAPDLPLVVVDAYVRATRTVGQEQPECGLQWWMVAGIGAVESGHGTFAGSTVDELGNTSGTIIGIPLNGENGTALIGDTDGGALDGDVVYDRAVGPMQFIPSSWRFFGRDGNDDGAADPHNLYDAALAAGDLLCWAAGDLTTEDGWRSALLTYNRHLAYVRAVNRAAAPLRPIVIPEPLPET